MNCFALTASNNCAILKKKNCRGCGFFKTKDKFWSDFKDAENRLKKIGKYEYYKTIYTYPDKEDGGAK